MYKIFFKCEEIQCAIWLYALCLGHSSVLLYVYVFCKIQSSFEVHLMGKGNTWFQPRLNIDGTLCSGAENTITKVEPCHNSACHVHHFNLHSFDRSIPGAPSTWSVANSEWGHNICTPERGALHAATPASHQHGQPSPCCQGNQHPSPCPPSPPEHHQHQLSGQQPWWASPLGKVSGECRWIQWSRRFGQRWLPPNPRGVTCTALRQEASLQVRLWPSEGEQLGQAWQKCKS